MLVYRTKSIIVHMYIDFKLADTVVMVPPDTFGFNAETASTNQFYSDYLSSNNIQSEAHREFDAMVAKLMQNNIKTIILPGKKLVKVPDAVFPNNWFTTHPDGTLAIYPMKDQTRQMEKQPQELQETLRRNKFKINRVLDFSKYEKEGKALEATGSMVIYHRRNYVFAVESARTDKAVLDICCALLGYTPVFFHATHQNKPIYHTNVMMNIGDGFVVICSEAIVDSERDVVLKKLKEFNLEIIEISLNQLIAYCANILHLRTKDNKKKIIMSDTAFQSFTNDQKNSLSKYGDFVVVDVKTIENVGGGSARCMMAEIFLPRSNVTDISLT